MSEQKKAAARHTVKPQLPGPLFIGDLHVGSHHAIYPLSRLPEFPQFLEPRYLAECMDHLLDLLPKKLGTVILNGDLIDGRNPKGQGTGVFSPRLSDQVEAAIEILQPLTKRATDVLRTTGTDYHDDVQGPLLALDIALKVRKSRQVFNLRLDNGRVVNVAHHPSGGGALYMGTKLDKEQRLMRLAAEAKKLPFADWIFRSHLHEFNIYRNKRSEVVLLPCWKFPDAHSQKGNLFGWQPDIGAAMLARDPNSERGYTVREFLYDAPEAEVFDLDDLEEVA